MKAGEKWNGFTFNEQGIPVCDKCGTTSVAGIIPMAMHWNDCVDGGKTLAALKELYTEKGDDLTVKDVDEKLNQ